MAASMAGVLDENLREKVINSKILVVGAGGIGCELLKNLVLTGFVNIETIDLDTIDVSNLNRQFLFRKEHVGKSKAQVAKDSALQFNPDASIRAYHDSITSPDYDLEFFRKFDIVMNALDNRAARNHVNRMCLAADRPLIESGTAGYLGQVSVIKKGLTECYECIPKPPQKTFPGCTIRNTPSEPIHCVVWAKHLFNQLFGEEDPDQDVSPDTADPELTADAGQKALETTSAPEGNGRLKRVSTRAWVEGIQYEPQKLFNKMFRDDIKYLLSMETLWKKRRPPTPLDWDKLPNTVDGVVPKDTIQDQRQWSVQECANVFSRSIRILQGQLAEREDGGMLVWDKDDDAAMDFVAAAANIRAHIFVIAPKTRFDIKSMAGNIIPAIATTNAVIAALIVMEGLKILNGDIEKCNSIYLNRQPNPRKKLLVPCALDKPNPKCYVCAPTNEVTVLLNVEKMIVKTFEEKVLKTGLGMVAPDVMLEDGKGTIIISSEEGETEENEEKFLSEFGVRNNSILKCDDFQQSYELTLIIVHKEKLEEDQEFVIVGDVSELQAKSETDTGTKAEGASNGACNQTGDIVVEEDDLMIVEDDPVETGTQKRKLEDQDDETGPPSAKKKRLSADKHASTDDDVAMVS
ncbi:SUMO-activating enzyme subunit 2-like isoform X1 [Dreissena polymorpha]|uniref:SUMO-activating enzyme subunit 2-like isoform X1 n=1 Tax=Dreissena polymorpha TaxID=45954 RepID=UPI00226555CB|nr:SUMO-activating enzyme subunit 2-like isoform X1 [Dreissena polymorpha]